VKGGLLEALVDPGRQIDRCDHLSKLSAVERRAGILRMTNFFGTVKLTSPLGMTGRMAADKFDMRRQQVF
jgi:hypothetical protein